MDSMLPVTKLAAGPRRNSTAVADLFRLAHPLHRHRVRDMVDR
jgi:hypothetical protein